MRRKFDEVEGYFTINEPYYKEMLEREQHRKELKKKFAKELEKKLI